MLTSFFVKLLEWKMPILANMKDNHTTELQEFTARLNAFLMDRFGYKSRLGNANKNRTIFIRRAKVKLYIRYRIQGEIWKHETFVIADFQFRKQRQGHGAALLKFICDHCLDHRIEYIGIEHTNDKSAAFAAKYGFHETEEKGCYVVAVEELRNKLVNIL